MILLCFIFAWRGCDFHSFVFPLLVRFILQANADLGGAIVRHDCSLGFSAGE